jgi:tetratricopeptide (TPR) repeat protein
MGAARLRLMAGAVVLSVRLVWGHESPEHEIEALTTQMVLSGKTADLLRKRATEWRALGKWKEASVDLQEAVSIRPRSAALLGELAQVEATRRRYGPALTALDQALASTSHADRAALYMLRAEVFETKGDYDRALADCSKAFHNALPGIDWYLTRGRLQARAGKWRECAAGLQEGFEATGSIVLEIEWIEALIDAGQFDHALQRIEPYAESGRWKSAWLIRRARAQIGRGDTTAAKPNLLKARAELATRLAGRSPETSLLIERGLAEALLGNIAEAEAALKHVQELKDESPMFSSALYRLERALKNKRIETVE